MKIIYIGIYRQVDAEKTARLAATENLSDFGYFTRGTISQHIQFGSRTGIQRTPKGQRQTIAMTNELPFVAHAYVRNDGLGAVVIADKEYPARVAFTLISKSLASYEERVGTNWKSMADDQVNEPEFLKADLVLYQNPREADKLTAVQTQLDEVKDVMQTNIEQLMKRGETLESLMDKSNDLNTASVQFYKQAKKANSCCKYY